MNIAVLGTGVVGQTLALALARNGHAVVIGTRSVAMARPSVAFPGCDPNAFAYWHRQHSTFPVMEFADAIAQGDIVINATLGASILDILASVRVEDFANKILVDVANDLDFSKGSPPTLRISDTPGASVGARIQTAFPQLHVVKTLNTVAAAVMVQPTLAAHGEATVFLSGNAPVAKQVVRSLLAEFGWDAIVDLGDIATARTAELLYPLWCSARVVGAGTTVAAKRVVA
jgi:8-hydroxy-5-deazaflavin:NADPH oxidoreductase